ncbi:Retroelement pol Polyprotein [Phytophthora megakarya]|uniref:RNA-directed DNA polymerase n=1 Tax=Phytophthora megakarya TaxID=4795 RepID=A0A225WTM8_9STRA|nr:Retroelement pol Polyprotein [Phytophthora megakarya]
MGELDKNTLFTRDLVSQTRAEVVYRRCSTVHQAVNAHQLLAKKGKLNGTPVKILLDSDADHNVVRKGLVTQVVRRKKAIAERFDGSVTDAQWVNEWDLPATHDVILGKPWFSRFNPNINWCTHEVILDLDLLDPLAEEAEAAGLKTCNPGERGVHWIVDYDPCLYFAGCDTTSNRTSRAPFRLSKTEQDALQLFVDELLCKQWIEVSDSPWVSSIFAVSKKDPTTDKAPSQIPKIPLPRIEDLFDRMQGSHFFSTLDLAQGYYQMLAQDGVDHPVAFLSKKLSRHEVNWRTHEKELFAIKLALSKWRHYLYGEVFDVFTDNSACKWFSESPECIGNIVADGLSRVERSRSSSGRQHYDPIDKVVAVVPADPRSNLVVHTCTPNCRRSEDFTANNSVKASPLTTHELADIGTIRKLDDLLFVVFPEERVVRLRVPNSRELRTALIAEAHAGIRRTQQKLALWYFWPSLAIDVKTYVQSLLDFVTGLPVSRGFDAIPSSLISSVRDRRNCKRPRSEVHQLHVDRAHENNGVKLRMKMSYRAQADGQVERQNRVLEDALRCMVLLHGTDRVDVLGTVEFFHSTLVRSSTKINFAENRRRIVAQAQQSLAEAQDRQRAQYNKKRASTVFAAGDFVYLATKNLLLAHTATVTSIQKDKLVGPFSRSMSCLHDTFTIDVIRHHVESPARFVDRPLPKVSTVDFVTGDADADRHVIEAQMKKRQRNRRTEYVVKWQNLDSSENT